MTEISVQDRLFPNLPCFGCGPSNPRGLQLKSYPANGFISAKFMPWPEHDNGLGFLNGGIIATILDCHSGATILHEAEQRGWHALGEAPLSYVTAGLDVRFLRPSPLVEPVELRGVITTATESEMTCEVELVYDGKTRAAATALWKRWRPR